MSERYAIKITVISVKENGQEQPNIIGAPYLPDITTPFLADANAAAVNALEAAKARIKVNAAHRPRWPKEEEES